MRSLINTCAVQILWPRLPDLIQFESFSGSLWSQLEPGRSPVGRWNIRLIYRHTFHQAAVLGRHLASCQSGAAEVPKYPIGRARSLESSSAWDGRDRRRAQDFCALPPSSFDSLRNDFVTRKTVPGRKDGNRFGFDIGLGTTYNHSITVRPPCVRLGPFSVQRSFP